MNVIPKEDLPYASLLKSVLGYVDTENFAYRDLTSEIHLNSGGLDFYVSSWEDLNEKGAFKGAFTAGIKVLYEKVGFAFDIIKEILTASKLDDEKRLGEILDEMQFQIQNALGRRFSQCSSCKSLLLFLTGKSL